MRICTLSSQDVEPVMDLARLVHDEDAANGLRAWLVSADAARDHGGKPVVVFGIKTDDGDLIATAGVGQPWESRIIYGFGELMTHPDYRCRGFATALIALRAAWIYAWTADGYIAPRSNDQPLILHATDVPSFHARFGYKTLVNYRPVSNSAVVMGVQADYLLGIATAALAERHPDHLALSLHVDGFQSLQDALLTGWAQAPVGSDLLGVKGIKSGSVERCLHETDLPDLLKAWQRRAEKTSQVINQVIR